MREVQAGPARGEAGPEVNELKPMSIENYPVPDPPMTRRGHFLPMRVRAYLTIIDSEDKRLFSAHASLASIGRRNSVTKIKKMDDDHGVFQIKVRRDIVRSWDRVALELGEPAMEVFERWRSQRWFADRAQAEPHT